MSTKKKDLKKIDQENEMEKMELIAKADEIKKQKFIDDALEDFEKIMTEISPYVKKKGKIAETTEGRWTISSLIN